MLCNTCHKEKHQEDFKKRGDGTYTNKCRVCFNKEQQNRRKLRQGKKSKVSYNQPIVINIGNSGYKIENHNGETIIIINN